MTTRNINRSLKTLIGLLLTFLMVSPVLSDPCGMVPPIYAGPGTPIKRIGLQQTYVFFDQGHESFVIRPAFQGKVDNFGMLIPFPSPPALRKVPDNVFDQIAAAVDPPEVVVDLVPRIQLAMAADLSRESADGIVLSRQKSGVNVLKQEAVGMYEVAVLEAGSAAALKAWMDQNKYQYPAGMDKVTEEYIESGWCFVAVKTHVGAKSDAEPRPGLRNARPEMPSGSVFDGTVQGLGFRFKTDELVVPMRLSAFNEGDLRNVVYLLARGGKKIRAIPEEYVVRQIPGKDLVANLTNPLPLRIIGGTEDQIPEYRRKGLKAERNPVPHNGVAKQIFVSDIAATSVDGFSLQHEEDEKELLRIGEHLGLRGVEIDAEIESVTTLESAQLIADTLPRLEELTLTVVDGDFPRDVIANQNLTFGDYSMVASRNRPESYDAKLHAPAPRLEGKRISCYLEDLPKEPTSRPNAAFAALGLAGFLLLVSQVLPRCCRKSQGER